MIKTTWTCDRCGAEQNEAKQMWEITLRFREITLPISSGAPMAQALWCRKCCEQYPQLLWDKKEPIPETAPTLEDLLREIIREEIQDASTT